MIETFKSAFWGTKERAEEILNEVRKLHSEDKGWHEVMAYLEKRTVNGYDEYRAVRVHYHN